MNKMFMMAVLATCIAGCAPLHPSNCHKTIALGSCDSGRFTDQDEYGRQANAIKNAIELQLTDPHLWKGKKCRLHLDFAADGTLQNIETRDGNKEYCAALKSAALKASFPAFPNKAVYDAFASSRFVLSGE